MSETQAGAVVRWSADTSTAPAEGLLSIGQQVRALRQAAGLTQTQLAERTGGSQPGIAQLEAGRRVPTLATLEKLAVALGHDLVVVLPCGLGTARATA